MSVKAWFKATICRRKQQTRYTFGSRRRMDGREEYVIKVPGWSGELRKYMTAEEASEWVNKSNKAVYCEAAEASKSILYGYEEFSANGKPGSHMNRAVGKMLARGFGHKE